MQLRRIKLPLFIAVITVYSCNPGKNSGQTSTYRGLYSNGPEMTSFKDCDNGSREYFVVDKSKQLELKYFQMNFEKPYEPVYVEIQGKKVKSGPEGIGAEYDSTVVVEKVIKITKEIPQDMCN